MARELIVVPNEEIISSGIWCKKLDGDDRHGKGIYEYSLINDLHLDYLTVGDVSESYNGFLWGTALAKLGHASLHVDDYMIICVPDNITMQQYRFFIKYRKYIEKFSSKFSFCFIDSNAEKVKSLDVSNMSLSRIKLFYNELENRINQYKYVEKELKK